MSDGKPGRGAPRILWLLALPLVGLLIPPLYNFRAPALFGIPFFYWYQLAWVPATMLITWIVFRRLPRP